MYGQASAGSGERSMNISQVAASSAGRPSLR